MKLTSMTPKWLIKNFLPNYKLRMRLNVGNEDKFFAEALENFAKAQRKECAKNAKVERVIMGHTGTHNAFGYSINEESIMNAPIPKSINNQEDENNKIKYV